MYAEDKFGNWQCSQIAIFCLCVPQFLIISMFAGEERLEALKENALPYRGLVQQLRLLQSSTSLHPQLLLWWEPRYR